MSEHHCRHCCTHKKDHESPRRRHLSPRSYKTHRRYRNPRRRYYIDGDREWQLANNIEDCAICKEPAIDDDPLNARCNNEHDKSKHYFHEHCLNTWLATGRSNTCPVCVQPCKPQDVVDRLVEESDDSGGEEIIIVPLHPEESDNEIDINGWYSDSDDDLHAEIDEQIRLGRENARLFVEGRERWNDWMENSPPSRRTITAFEENERKEGRPEADLTYVNFGQLVEAFLDVVDPWRRIRGRGWEATAEMIREMDPIRFNYLFPELPPALR